VSDFITTDQVESALGLDLYDEDIEAYGFQSLGFPTRFLRQPLEHIAARIADECCGRSGDPDHGSLGVVLRHYLETCRAEGTSVTEDLVADLLIDRRCVQLPGGEWLYHYYPKVIDPPHMNR